jgi:hypothetical protein
MLYLALHLKMISKNSCYLVMAQGSMLLSFLKDSYSEPHVTVIDLRWYFGKLMATGSTKKPFHMYSKSPHLSQFQQIAGATPIWSLCPQHLTDPSPRGSI